MHSQLKTNRVNQHFLVLLFAALFSSCAEEFYDPTFSAVVGGLPWYSTATTYYIGDDEVSYLGFGEMNSMLQIEINHLSETTFALDSVNGAWITWVSNDWRYECIPGTGKVVVETISDHAAEGTFSALVKNDSTGETILIEDGWFSDFPSE
jgi:hypothetical protein